jgi:rare lipoprotein A
MEPVPNPKVLPRRQRATVMRRQGNAFGATAIMAIICGACTLSAALGAELKSSSFSGKASYYSEGGRVASGGKFDPAQFTAAHRTLPFGTKVRVTANRSGQSVIVTINDRGPFSKARVLDLSPAAAKVLGMTGLGIINVTADVMQDVVVANQGTK